MTDNQTRRITTFGRIAAFGELYPLDFPPGSKGQGLLAIITTASGGATEGGADQVSSDGKARAGTETKADFYDDLYEDLQEINRTAKGIALEVPGLDEKFRMPRSPSYSSVLASARAFLKDATILEAKFLEYEMAADFLADLTADIAAFEAADDNQGEGMIQRVGATRTIAEEVAAGSTALRMLDPMMQNKYSKQPPKLAEWLTASHVERAPKKKAKVALPG